MKPKHTRTVTIKQPKRNLSVRPTEIKSNISHKEIKETLGINTGALDLYVEAILDGEKLWEVKANSLVTNFLRILYAFAGRTAFDDALKINWSTDSGRPMYGTSADFDNVTGVTPGNPTVITKTNSNNWGNTNVFVQLFGIGGITPDINGFHQVTASTATTITININTTGSPAFIDQGARARKFLNSGAYYPHTDTLEFPPIKVGRSATANIVDQQSLVNEWDDDEDGFGETNEINYGAPILAFPSLDYTNKRGELPFSITVVNNSGATLVLNEIGLYVKTDTLVTNISHWCLIARDVLPTTVNLATGSSLTFNYKLRASMGANGGFNENFVKLLYTQFNQAASPVTIDDFFASTFDSVEDQNKFASLSVPGHGKVAYNLAGVEGQYIGLQIGTGTTATAFDDHQLDARITHGQASGEMLYRGTTVENFKIVGNVASFDLIAVFENLSGGTINVAEIGWTCYNDLGSNGEFLDVALIARHIISGGPVAVLNTELLKLTYTVQLTVS